MPMQFLFWGIYIIAIVFGLWSNYDATPAWPRRAGALSSSLVIGFPLSTLRISLMARHKPVLLGRTLDLFQLGLRLLKCYLARLNSGH